MHDRQFEIQFPLTKYQLECLIASISTPRFGTYLRAANFDRKRAIDLYRWNGFIGECLHFPLQATEIALRNAVSASLMDLYGVDWNAHPELRSILNYERQQDIEVAERRLRNRLATFNGDDVVAALSFGFWAYMLEPRYYQAIWRTHLRKAFPGLPQGRAHKSVHLRAKGILELRNRVAHHEPLINRNLSKEHSELVEFVGWLSPEKAHWVRRHSFVQSALRQRP